MSNEYAANQHLADGRKETIQSYIADRNAQTRLSEQLEKERKNELFWGRVVKTIATIVVVFTLFHFA